MKQLIFVIATLIVLAIAAIPTRSQPVAKADAVALLAQLAAPPSTLAEAYLRAYPQGADKPDTKPYYSVWLGRVDQAAQESQTALLDFYKKNPTGIPKLPQHPASRVTVKDQSAMDHAVSELAQKMLNDPAFAKQFQQMSETEQHAYMAKALADNGLKPVQGTPNMPNAPMPGTDIDWATPCNTYLAAAMDHRQWNDQMALQQKYETQHAAVRAWTEAEIKKLPMISFGEYGHDYDPVKVKAIQRQGLNKHRDIANAMMQEFEALFGQFRRHAQQRMQPLNDALKKVDYGQDYSFGLNYTLVLQAQSMMFGDIQNIARNEMDIIQDIAHWEYEWQHDTP